MDERYIEIKGARTHNLKNINLKIPKDKLVVITGLSGSGKSSLAFDTIYAEGQRRYVESLSAYARQFLGLMEKPDVELITGLSPAISIDQKGSSHNPRSTVGTITEIYDYLRLLFARAGHSRSPVTGHRLQKQTVQEIVDQILSLNKKLKQDEIKLMLLAPVVKERKGTYEDLFRRFLTQGYIRTRVDGHIYNLEETIELDKFQKHNIEIVIDRIIIKPDIKNDKDLLKRITDSVELTLNLGRGEMYLSINSDSESIDDKILVRSKTKESNTFWHDVFFSEKLVDPETGESFPEIEPHTFSFNSPHGACPKCSGIGHIKEIDPELIFNPNLSINEGGIFPWANIAEKDDSWTYKQLLSIASHEGFSLKEPIKNISKEKINILLYGSSGKKYTFEYTRKRDNLISTYERDFEGLIPNLMRRYNETESEYIQKEIESYMRETTCPECQGLRLKRNSLAVTIAGRNIVDIGNMSIEDTLRWIEAIKSGKTLDIKNPSIIEQYLGLVNIDLKKDLLSNIEIEIAKQIFKELKTRLGFLISVGLNYLTLNRTAKTLSGGEGQRIRLASQIGTGLTGVLYVLDEPSIGLHQRDNHKLLATLKNLREIGNTVIVVEHDEDTIRSADHIVDMGPGAGIYGGEVVAEGNLDQIMKIEKSITGQFLSKKRIIDRESINKKVLKFVPEYELSPNQERRNLYLKGCSHNNLKNINVEIPLGKFVCITGVSGSGKSSLINDTLYPILSQKFYRSKLEIGKYEKIEGVDAIDKVVNIDQSPIGRTPRSNPATYTGVFTKIRELFAETREAKIRGYKSGRFSFNIKGGRCENCGGDGVIKIEMQFLPDVYIKCDICDGSRYNRDTLQIDYKGYNINDVLNMNVEEATEFFRNIPAIYSKLKVITDVGLGYIKLGQSATTLSGGEAQRVKLATELSRRSTGKTLYILDEPTTGLHFEDVEKLLVVLHSLVRKGNSVLVIEHNLDVIKTSDWIIDLGPEGGDRGGSIIATGTPEMIANNPSSFTGHWLKK